MAAVNQIHKHLWTGILRFTVLKRQSVGLRTILSEAYPCQDEWQKRLENPLLKNVKMGLYFIEADKKFQTKRLASGVDIDIFANCVCQPSELEEIEHLLFRFRKTKRAAEITDATACAVVRVCLQLEDYETLFRILRNRESYGIFPDFYTYNLLMDTFLKMNRIRDAAEIATMMMLQEDFTNPLSRLLGLHCCQKFLDECAFDSWHPEPEKAEETEQADEDEDEVTYVRVHYLRNPCFDDHFDIEDPKHLIGKTLYLIGRAEGNTLGNSYQLFGLGMYEKWEKALWFLGTVAKDSASPALLAETVTKFKEMLLSVSDEKPEKANWIEEFEKIQATLQKQGKLTEGKLADQLEQALKKIPELEKADVQAQKELFAKWETVRKELLDAENKDIDKEKRLKVIADKKEELYWKEKLLFFFENEDKIMEELEEVNKIVESQKKPEAAGKDYEPPKIMRKTKSKLAELRKKAMIKSV